MAGHFTLTNPEQCEHYARFIHRLTRRQADVIFWGNFCLTIILLIIASQMYTKASLNPNHRRIRVQCLLISILCFLIALPAVAFSALAGLQIEFCDGEDLMHFYWSFWTLIQVNLSLLPYHSVLTASGWRRHLSLKCATKLRWLGRPSANLWRRQNVGFEVDDQQVGSLIAIMGVGVNQCYGIGGKRGPPWNVALGTPVLVIAALGHAGETGGKAIWKRISKRTLREDGNDSDNSRAASGAGSGSESEVEVDLEAQVKKEGETEEHREERMDKTGNLSPGFDTSRASTIINSSRPRPSATLAHRQSYSSSLSDGGGFRAGLRCGNTGSVESLPTREIRFADEEEEGHGEQGHGEQEHWRKSLGSLRRHERQ